MKHGVETTQNRSFKLAKTNFARKKKLLREDAEIKIKVFEGSHTCFLDDLQHSYETLDQVFEVIFQAICGITNSLRGNDFVRMRTSFSKIRVFSSQFQHLDPHFKSEKNPSSRGTESGPNLQYRYCTLRVCWSLYIMT